MWLTSKRPARVRTASCSARMPVYSSGISHPPKSTMRAFRRRCVALSGVLRSSAVCGELTQFVLENWEEITGISKLACVYGGVKKRTRPRESEAPKLWKTPDREALGGRAREGIAGALALVRLEARAYYRRIGARGRPSEDLLWLGNLRCA